MDWFGRLLSRGRDSDDAPLPDTTAEAIRAISTPASPPLCLLVRDAAGLAALRLHTFSNVETACEYIEFWYPERREGSIIAFWAVAAEPVTDPSVRVEPTVLVRDLARPGVVYPFSFLSLEEAQIFVRRELHRGVEPESILLFWSVSIRIAVGTEGHVYLTPSEPPPNRSPRAPLSGAGTSFRTRTDPIPSMGPGPRYGSRPPERNLDAIGRQIEHIVSRLDEPEEDRYDSTVLDLERDEDEFDRLSDELLKFLHQKRFEQQDEPFDGFNSPPGRF